MTGFDERTYIKDLAEGNPEAFSLVVEEYRDKIISLCYNFVHDRDEAEDLSQEVFIELYRSLGSFRFEASLRTWIYRIAVNKSLNHLRSKKRRGFIIRLENLKHDGSTSDDAGDLPAADEPDRLEQQELSKALDRAISSLPGKQRTAFLLYRSEDLSYKEIAEITGNSLSSVESLIHRAHVNLRKKLIKIFR